MNKKNILVGQSGGPTAVINGSLYGVICEGARHSDAVGCVYGMINGIEGFLADSYMNLSETLSDDDLELLRLTPAAYLGSCRFKLPENLSDSFYRVLFEKLERLDIGYFFYIGGNDSMDTVSKLSRYAAQIKSPIRFIGIPKTIDNDLVLITRRDTAVLPAMSLHPSVKLRWTPLSISRNRSPSLKSWDAMPDG